MGSPSSDPGTSYFSINTRITTVHFLEFRATEARWRGAERAGTGGRAGEAGRCPVEGEGSQEEAAEHGVGLQFGEVNGREPLCRAVAEGPGLRTGPGPSSVNRPGAGTRASVSLCEQSLQQPPPTPRHPLRLFRVQQPKGISSQSTELRAWRDAERAAPHRPSEAGVLWVGGHGAGSRICSQPGWAGLTVSGLVNPTVTGSL